MKPLVIIATACLTLISTSVWYYFLIFLPSIEQQKMEILKNEEIQKQEVTKKLNACIDTAEKMYFQNLKDWCEWYKSQIESCQNTIESDYKLCLVNDDNKYERCKAEYTYWFDTQWDANRIKANCWKKWCAKKTCDTYREENGSCYLPRDTINHIDIQKLGDISRCKEQY